MQYQTFLIKGFAYEVCRFIYKVNQGPMHGGVSIEEPYKRLVDFEIDDDLYDSVDPILSATRNNTNYGGLFGDNYRNMPVFFHAFY